MRSEKRLENARFESVRLENVRVKLKNVRLENVRTGLRNVRPQRSFLEADEARHLQLHLPGPRDSQVGNGKKTEYQQLRYSWLEDNRFGMYRADVGFLLGLAALESIAE